MKEPKKNFQKEILYYNIATAYLADRQFEKAYQEFSHILSQADRFPKHLTERARYNQLLSQLGWIDSLLSEEELTQRKENLKKSDPLIEEAFQTLNLYSEFKYDQSLEDSELPDEIMELKNSLKEVKSKWKKSHQEIVLGELDLTQGIEKVKGGVQGQLEVIEHYFKKSFLHDFLRYALSREYINAKKEIPLWDRIKELLQQKRQELEVQAGSTDSLKESEEILALQKSYEIFFSEAESSHKTALDCFKEHYLKRAWVELNKAKYGLSFMQQVTGREDLFKFCLHQKSLQGQKLQSNDSSETYLEATYDTLGYLNQLAQGFSKYLEESSSHSEEDAHAGALREQILKMLSKRLTEEQTPTLEKLLQDEALYGTLLESPTSWLLPLYAKLESKKPIGVDEKDAFAPKLFALKERFKIESQFKKLEAKNKQIEAVNKHLALFESHWSADERKSAQRALEDLLINLDYPALVLHHLSHIQKLYELANRDIHFEDSYRKRIEARKNRILSFPLTLKVQKNIKLLILKCAKV